MADKKAPSKKNTKKTKQKNTNVSFNDIKEVVIKNYLSLIVSFLAFTVGYLLAYTNRKNKILMYSYLIVSSLSLIIALVIYFNLKKYMY